MNRYSLVVLVLVLIVMGGVYFLMGPDDMNEATYSVPTGRYLIDSDRIVRVDISRVDGFVRLEKVRGEWKVTEPVYASADPAHIKELQEGMTRFRLSGMVSTNPAKRNVFKVGDEGTNVVFITDDGKNLSLVVGKAAPTRGSSFVRPPLSDTVYVAQGLTPALVNRDLRDWRHRTLYEVSPEAITSLNFKAGPRRFEIERREIGWVSRDRTVPVDVIGPSLLALSRLRADAFIDTPLIVRGQPRFEVEVGGPEPVRLDFYSTGAGDTNYVLKTSASPNLVVVGPAVVTSLQRVAEFLTPRPQPEPVAAVEAPSVERRPPVPAAQPQVQPPQRERTATTATPRQPGQTTAERRRSRQASPAPSTPQTQGMPQTSDRAVTQGDDQRPTRRAAETTQRRIEDEGELTVHKVQRGETIATIARRYDVTVDQLKRWNGLQSDILVPGAEVYVFVRRR